MLLQHGYFRGTGILIKKQRQILFFMDHSYFKSENKEDEWYRKNNH